LKLRSQNHQIVAMHNFDPRQFLAAHFGGAELRDARANSVPFKSQIRTTSPAANSPSQRATPAAAGSCPSRARPASRRRPRTMRPGMMKKRNPAFAAL